MTLIVHHGFLLMGKFQLVAFERKITSKVDIRSNGAVVSLAYALSDRCLSYPRKIWFFFI